MGSPVLADAQFGMAKILRPFTGWEDVYDGQSALRPLMFTESGRALDPSAGKPGFDPKLVRGTHVPMGATVNLWLPAVLPDDYIDDQGIGLYKYLVTWRLRSVYDRRNTRGPYHYPKQGLGYPDTTAPAGSQARVMRPAAFAPAVYTISMPSPPGPGSVYTEFPDGGVRDYYATIEIAASAFPAESGGVTTQWPYVPLLPDGTDGHVSQGTIQPSLSTTTAFAQTYIAHSMKALGDELLIGIYREPTVGHAKSTWNTDLADRFLQRMLALVDNGVYLMAGTGSAG